MIDDAMRAVAALGSDAGRRALSSWGGSVIVDLDDTLIVNEPLFAAAHAQLGHVLAELDADGRAAFELAAQQEAYDVALMSTFGFTPARMRTSALVFAAQIAGRPLTAEETHMILEVIETALVVGDPLPGAFETLAILQQSQVPVVLCTKGHLAKQHEKVAVHELRSRVTGVIVGEDKTAQTFRDAIEHFTLRDPVVLGDSLRSDILPAQQAGLPAVLITHAPPSAWNGMADVDRDIPRAASIAEAMCLLAGVTTEPVVPA